MPERAQSTTFGELIKLGILEIGDGYRAKLEELGGDGPIFLRAGLVNEHGIDWTQGERFHAELSCKIQPKLGYPGDAMVTTKGNSVGRTGYVPLGSPSFVYSPHLSYWRSLDSARLLPGFLRYWSKSPEFTIQLQAMANGTDMAPYLSLADQRRLRISLPRIGAQEAVVGVLSALDDKIVVNNQIATAGEEFAICLAGRGALSASVPLGRIICNVRDQVSPEAIDRALVAHYSLPAFDLGRIPELVAPSSIKSSKFIVNAPSVLVSKLNPSIPRIWSVYPSQGFLALASTEFLVLEPNDGISPDVLWAVCSLPDFTKELAGKATGTSNSHQRVKPADLLAAEVVNPLSIPSDDLDLIDATCARVRQARVESLALADLRDTLLPKLMSGEIQVRDAETAVKEAT